MKTRIGITGISGSFGSALCARLAADPANTIVGMTRDELKAEQIMARFRQKHDNVRAMVIAAGVSDEEAMNRAFRGCDILVHAAAIKRISGSVYATEELVKTNILGTMKVLEVSRKQGIQKTLFISSDKACEATNLYGSTKFTAECLAVQSNAFIYPATGGIVSCVRWGNVLGSRGSVLHIWRRQRDAGLPLTITDDRMTRFIISMDEAVSFALDAIRAMEGGEIFVPNLRAAFMCDLAKAVIAEKYPTCAEGLGPGFWQVRYSGLRPGGEKLHEILLTQEEPMRASWWHWMGSRTVPHGVLIRPSHCTWREWPKPEQLEKGIALSSDRAAKMTVEELTAMVREVPLSQEEAT